MFQKYLNYPYFQTGSFLQKHKPVKYLVIVIITGPFNNSGGLFWSVDLYIRHHPSIFGPPGILPGI